MKQHGFIPSALTLGAFALLSACGGGGGGDDSPKTVTLEFAAVAGSTPVACGSTVSGLGSGAVDAAVQDLRFYISNVKLVKADGTELALTLGANDDWNYSSGGNTLTLIDLEDASGNCSSGTTATNARITGTVPAGDYVGVKMTMGVPFALNHSDYAAAPAPLDLQAMAWSWQSGRKFAKLEFVDPAGTAGSWTAKSFYVHLGSTGCTGNPASGETVSCVASNRMDFSLARFDPSTQKIAVDVAALLAGTDITVNRASAPGCMSGGTDPECLHVFESFALDWKADGTGTGLPINGGAAQTLFKAVSK
ncbi:MbnP family copper-binding protein [Rubrivivax gelatinosus]|uniref:Metallo-mystery pair system four-Cys motif protein n=1 Tax=Rubrivivax gelatinosus TaxID=28068 RepID=A0ABS1DT63_RUBGE|nr:MbnP family copper-binding protein [Rubrivivax gelatinosus]MBK1712673.1 metallo-mystery pair system four-Cys motif protein [Rubrivivax gelatinosus]